MKQIRRPFGCRQPERGEVDWAACPEVKAIWNTRHVEPKLLAPVELDDDQPNQFDNEAYANYVEYVWEQAQTLRPRLRKIISLRFMHDMSYAELGKILDVSSTRARQLETTALRQLLSQLARSEMADPEPVCSEYQRDSGWYSRYAQRRLGVNILKDASITKNTQYALPDKFHSVYSIELSEMLYIGLIQHLNVVIKTRLMGEYHTEMLACISEARTDPWVDQSIIRYIFIVEPDSFNAQCIADLLDQYFAWYNKAGIHSVKSTYAQCN